jgi:hypothetical protein
LVVMSAERLSGEDRVDLYWLPLGAGATLPVVRWSGRLFEAVVARRGGRLPQDLYHAALEIWLDDMRYTVEMAPAWGNGHGQDGVIGNGPVGFRMLGRSRFFSYEVRRWRNGVIPDLSEAVDGVTHLTSDTYSALGVFEAVSSFPPWTWGRDEIGVGDMWNSNSLVAWAITRAGIDASSLAPPTGGRAPGWSAGVIAASR